MVIFIYVYLIIAFLLALITVVLYNRNPEKFKGCDFRILPNVIAFFLWPLHTIVVTIKRILKG